MRIYIYRRGFKGNIGQLNKGLTVKNINELIKKGDINLVSRIR